MSAQAELTERIVLHERWLVSLGNDGEQISFEDRDFRNVNLDRANLSGARFGGCHFQGGSFVGADFSAADVSGSIFDDCDMSNCQLAKIVGWNATFRRTRLTESNLTRAELIRGCLDDANLARSTLRGVNFADASLVRANLDYSDMRDVYCIRSNLSGASIRGAVLESVSMVGSVTVGMSGLSEANLKSIIVAEIANGGVLTGDEALRWLQSESR